MKSKYKIIKLLIFFRCLVPVAVVAGLCLAAGTAFAHTEPPDPSLEAPKQVLILNSHDYGMPWQRMANEAIYATLVADSDIQKRIYTEYTGLSQNFDDAYVRKLLDLYSHKYAHHKIDLIISVDVAATDFLLDHGDELFSSVPIVFVSGGQEPGDMALRLDMTGVVGTRDVNGTLDVALALHPGTRHIAIISGASKMDRTFEAEVRRALDDYEDRFEIIDLTGLSMDQLLAGSSRLPDQTVGIYVLTLMDGGGKAFIPRQILSRISEASNAPLYGLWDSLLGGGIVGGHLSSAEAEGAKAAEMGLRILRGEKPEDIPLVRGSHSYMFDWDQLRRWGISESDLPAGSVVRYKELSFWDLYRWRITGVSVLVAAEGMLILALFVQLARRRRAEQMLKTAHDGLELRVEQRTRELVQSNERMQKEIGDRKQAEQALADSERRMADIIEFLPDPTWVIDADGRVIAWNQAVEQMTGIDKSEMIGKGDHVYAAPFYGEPRPTLIDLVLKRDGEWEEKYLSLREENGQLIASESFHPLMGEDGRYLAGAAGGLYDAQGNIVGAIETVRDITLAKRSEQERERLITELQDAIAEIRTLSGLLPICSSCKKIRDDKGYWKQIETYISEHSRAEFSHGICPECARTLYPDLDVYPDDE